MFTWLTRFCAVFTGTFIISFVGTTAYAEPRGGTITSGDASISGQNTGKLTVHQRTPKAIINWNSFNIGKNETTRFVQPNASSIALNRVTSDGRPSQILGTLSANGQIFLINPNGFVFGKNAVINTAGFLATTSDIRDEDFLAGRYVFSPSTNPAGTIVNQGEITVSDAGVAALVAPGVRNEGIIAARLGKVALSSANAFTLDLYGDDLIKFSVSDAVASRVIDPITGEPLRALVSNKGTLSADGGVVALTATTARAVVDSVVNNTGIIEAKSAGLRNGRIVLGASSRANKPASAPTQKVTVSGRLDASGKQDNQTGGQIQITGESISIASATLDAAGTNGGGKILIGGDYFGGTLPTSYKVPPGFVLEDNPVPTADSVRIQSDVTLDASAISVGDGGKVVVWSDETTRFEGQIVAFGGNLSGNGGLVEISGKEHLYVVGQVNVDAPAGLPGTVLLDPRKVIITTAGDELGNLDCTTVGGVEECVEQDPDVVHPRFLKDDNTFVWAFESITIASPVTNTGSLSFSAPVIQLLATASLSGVDIQFSAETLNVAGPIVAENLHLAGDSILLTGSVTADSVQFDGIIVDIRAPITISSEHYSQIYAYDKLTTSAPIDQLGVGDEYLSLGGPSIKVNAPIHASTLDIAGEDVQIDADLSASSIFVSGTDISINSNTYSDFSAFIAGMAGGPKRGNLKIGGSVGAQSNAPALHVFVGDNIFVNAPLDFYSTSDSFHFTATDGVFFNERLSIAGDVFVLSDHIRLNDDVVIISPKGVASGVARDSGLPDFSGLTTPYLWLDAQSAITGNNSVISGDWSKAKLVILEGGGASRKAFARPSIGSIIVELAFLTELETITDLHTAGNLFPSDLAMRGITVQYVESEATPPAVATAPSSSFLQPFADIVVLTRTVENPMPQIKAISQMESAPAYPLPKVTPLPNNAALFVDTVEKQIQTRAMEIQNRRIARSDDAVSLGGWALLITRVPSISKIFNSGIQGAFSEIFGLTVEEVSSSFGGLGLGDIRDNLVEKFEGSQDSAFSSVAAAEKEYYCTKYKLAC